MQVEESFNLQATHDVLVHGRNITAYDHHEFPGVVPRTFLGPAYLALWSSPALALVKHLQLPKIFLQLAVRGVLAALVCSALWRMKARVAQRLGERTALALTLLVCCTPHFLFYASRTLPNVFALYLVLNGYAEWMYLPQQQPVWSFVGMLWPQGGQILFSWPLARAITFFVLAVIWFRCDMLVLLGPVALSWLIMGKANMLQLLVLGGIIGVVALTITVGFDSWMWQRWLWPEGEVLFFNTVLNRSHEYGVSPWHWYFTSALPRSMLAALVLVPLGCVRLAAAPAGRIPGGPATSLLAAAKRVRLDAHICEYTFPALLFVGLYSFLPHKELRFILPALPLLFVAAARGATRLYRASLSMVMGAELSDTAATETLAPLSTDADSIRDDAFGTRSTSESASAAGKKAAASSSKASAGASASGLRQRHGRSNLSINAASPTGSRANEDADSPVPSPPASRNKARGLSLQVNTAGDHAPASRSGLRRLSAGVVGELEALPDRAPPGPWYVRVVGVIGLGSLILALVGSIVATAVFVRVTMDNYPGGSALVRLHSVYASAVIEAEESGTTAMSILPWTGVTHDLPPCPEGDVSTWGFAERMRRRMDRGLAGTPFEDPGPPVGSAPRACIDVLQAHSASHLRPVRVHIDVAAAETGVSRFGEAWSSGAGWVYSKAENLKQPADFAQFDFLITENVTMHAKEWAMLESVPALKRIQWWPFKVVTSPELFVLQKKVE